MWIPFKGTPENFGPYEKLVTIETADGDDEEIVVHPRAIEDSKVEVGQVLRQNGRTLVELPSETASGQWRIWVPTAALSNEPSGADA